MSLVNKTFIFPKTRFNSGFIHIGKTFKIVSKIRGLDRYKIVLLTKTGKESTFSTCGGAQWLTPLVK